MLDKHAMKQQYKTIQINYIIQVIRGLQLVA